jgi:hypothetical protein
MKFFGRHTANKIDGVEQELWMITVLAADSWAREAGAHLSRGADVLVDRVSSSPLL